MGFESIRIDTRENASGGVTQAFVKVGVEIVGDKEVFVHQFAHRSVGNEFFIETVAV